MSPSSRGAAALWSLTCASALWGCGPGPAVPAARTPETAGVAVVAAAEPESNGGPMYKPSSNSAQMLDISTNAYGAFSAAPDAPKIGDIAADFELPLADGGTISLAEARKAGPVLVMFYRGFW